MARRCFVIGPMSGPHMKTLNWLAYDVVKPLLPDDFVVETPDAHQIGNIMHQVVRSCDRAHLVVADITGNNPNVLYEIAVLDAMGRACIPVKTGGSAATERDRVPFDRAQYRSITISRAPSKRPQTDQIMREAIANALAIREAGDIYENPLTDFFGVPLSSFSSAYALARGYYFNLLKPAVQGLLAGHVQGSAFDPERFTAKSVQVIMPDSLGQASRTNVEDLCRRRRHLREVEIAASGRPITLYEWPQQEEPVFRWLDIPTTMAGLRETVLGRRGRDANPDPSIPDYREIERDEIEQFRRALLGFIRRDLDADDLQATVAVIDWGRTALP